MTCSRIWMLGIVAVLFLSGCATQYDQEFLDEASSQGWSSDEQLAAYYHSYRLQWAKETEDGTWRIDYASLSNKDVLNTINSMRSDIKQILESPEWARMVHNLDMGEALLRKDAQLKLLRQRLAEVRLHERFSEAVGVVSSQSTNGVYSNPPFEACYAGVSCRKRMHPTTPYGTGLPPYAEPSASSKSSKSKDGYDLSVLWPTEELDDYVFEPQYIQEARESGNLRQTGVFLTRGHSEALKNEEWQTKSDRAFVGRMWRATDHGDGQEADVIQIYRIQDDAISEDAVKIKPEANPFFSCYRPVNGDSVSVCLADVDLPDEPGYGTPDDLVRLSGLQNVREAMKAHHKKVTKYADYEDPSDTFDRPEQEDVKLEIARAGETDISEWEVNENGWEVPFSYRKEGADGSPLYRASVNVEDSKIQSLAKIWRDGSVREIFRPLDEYADIDVADVETKKQKVTITPKSGSAETALLPTFAEGQAFRIVYRIDGKEFTLWDEDGDGTFEKRKVKSL